MDRSVLTTTLGGSVITVNILHKCTASKLSGSAMSQAKTCSFLLIETKFLDVPKVICGASWGLSGKESSCQCRRHEFYLRVGKIH